MSKLEGPNAAVSLNVLGFVLHDGDKMTVDIIARLMDAARAQDRTVIPFQDCEVRPAGHTPFPHRPINVDPS